MKKLAPKKGARLKTCVFLSDIHTPYVDNEAFLLAKKILKDVSPQIIVIGGDLIDFYAVSTFLVDMSQADIFAEIKTAKDILREIRDMFPRAEIHYIEGNHEERLQKYILIGLT